MRIVILSLIGTLLIYSRLLGPGIPQTHDGPIHTVRMASYYLALQQGQFPPRLGPNMANGLGYPVFNYNYPLANMAAVPLIKLHFSYPVTYQLVVLGFIWFGVMGLVRLLQFWGLSGWNQFFGAGLYLINPFLISQVFVRGGVGEIAFISLFPWTLWSIGKLLRNPGTDRFSQLGVGVTGTLLALTHNVLFVFCIPILVIYCLWLSRKNIGKLFLLVVPTILVLLLSAFFWIPALLEKSLVILDDVPITNQFSEHFLYIHQLVTGSWSYGYSRPGPVDGLSFSISVTELLFLLVITGTLWKWRSHQALVALWVITLSCFGMTLLVTQPLWKVMPFSFYIQFPWRLLWFGHFFLLLLIVLWLQEYRVPRWIVIGVLVVAVGNALIISMPQRRTDRTQEEWLRAGETTSTMNENLPRTAHLNLAYRLLDHTFGDQLVWTSTSSATVSISSWNGTERRYQIITTAPVDVVERTFYFPGWETKLNQKLIQTDFKDPWKAGLLTYHLSPGTYQVETQFTQHTFARKLGNGLTLVGLLLLLLVVIKR